MVFLNGFTKLKRNTDFKRAYHRGKSYVHPAVVTYITRTKFDNCRIGVTTGKKLGCAVQRNRARRIITAAFRDCVPQITVGCDIVFVARRRILSLKSTDLTVILKNQLVSAGVIPENREWANCLSQLSAFTKTIFPQTNCHVGAVGSTLLVPITFYRRCRRTAL